MTTNLTTFKDGKIYFCPSDGNFTHSVISTKVIKKFPFHSFDNSNSNLYQQLFSTVLCQLNLQILAYIKICIGIGSSIFT